MQIRSKAPHDFWLTLDASNYWEAEHDPEEIYEGGFARPIVLSTRDVLAVIRYNENFEEPVFDVSFPHQEPLSEAEEREARAILARILGADLELKPLMEQAADDPVLGPLMEDYYGFKRVAGANVWEDAVSDIIRTRISHDPTAKRMVQDVRKTWGSRFHWRGRDYYSYPRPESLLEATPDEFREFGISRRKAEYVIGLAELLHEGELDLDELETMEPADFYERIQDVRGIGPSTAQSLMHFRNRPDAVFPSRKKDGKEKGFRRWIAYSYDEDPHDMSEEEFQELTAAWSGFEALALRFLYYDYLMRQARKSEQ